MQLFNSKRKLKNVTLTKEFHLRYYGWWLFISIFLIGFLAWAMILLFEEYWQSILIQDPYRTLEYAVSRWKYVGYITFGSLLLTIGITCLGIMTAHRVGGPLIKLKQAFTAVKSGNLDYRLHFRKEDELKDLEMAFNEMMDSLREHHSK